MVGSSAGISQIKIKCGLSRSALLLFCFVDCYGNFVLTRNLASGTNKHEETYCLSDTIHLSELWFLQIACSDIFAGRLQKCCGNVAATVWQRGIWVNFIDWSIWLLPRGHMRRSEDVPLVATWYDMGVYFTRERGGCAGWPGIEIFFLISVKIGWKPV